jgi:hypothetical protein
MVLGRRYYEFAYRVLCIACEGKYYFGSVPCRLRFASSLSSSKMIHPGINLHPILTFGYARFLKMKIILAINVTGSRNIMHPTRQDCLLYQPYSNSSPMASPTAAVLVYSLQGNIRPYLTQRKDLCTEHFISIQSSLHK